MGAQPARVGIRKGGLPVTQANRSTPELQALVDLFYGAPEALGTFREVFRDDLTAAAQELLDHDEHMTVTVEDYHDCSVSVEVLETRTTDTHYARKILLRRERDSEVVQFGLVRLNLNYLDAPVRREIESQHAPLGRVLIEHDVLRKVRLLSLWRLEPGSELCEWFRLTTPVTCFGRTALIYCNGVPAVELLEIVTPS